MLQISLYFEEFKTMYAKYMPKKLRCIYLRAQGPQKYTIAKMAWCLPYIATIGVEPVDGKMLMHCNNTLSVLAGYNFRSGEGIHKTKAGSK